MPSCLPLQVRVSSEHLLYVNVPGGSGKTYLLNLIAHKLLLEGRTVVSCAYTGLAASLLVNGRTSHSVWNPCRRH